MQIIFLLIVINLLMIASLGMMLMYIEYKIIKEVKNDTSTRKTKRARKTSKRN